MTHGPVGRVLVIASNGGAVLHHASYERAATLATAQITAYLAGVPVVQTVASGDPGQVVTVAVGFDAMDTVRVGTTNGVLVDVCYVDVAQDATIGWALTPGFPDPMRLPVTHPNYPAGASPVNKPAAEALALGRIRYGPTAPWAGASFAQLHDGLLLPLVQGGPAGTSMDSNTQAVA